MIWCVSFWKMPHRWTIAYRGSVEIILWCEQVVLPNNPDDLMERCINVLGRVFCTRFYVWNILQNKRKIFLSISREKWRWPKAFKLIETSFLCHGKHLHVCHPIQGGPERMQQTNFMNIVDETELFLILFGRTLILKQNDTMIIRFG